MRLKGAARRESWAEKSSLEVTPGRPWTARRGSSARTLARLRSSVPARLRLGSAGKGPAWTWTVSVRRRDSGIRRISRSVVSGVSLTVNWR